MSSLFQQEFLVEGQKGIGITCFRVMIVMLLVVTIKQGGEAKL